MTASDPRWASQREARPWPLAPLARRLGIPVGSTAVLAVRLGRDRRTIMRYRAWGLTTRQADEWCTAVDVNPAEVWPAWTDPTLRGVALVNAARETCRRGHPLDGVNARGERTCSTCLVDAVRRYRAKKSAKAQLMGHITQEAS